LSLIFFFSLPVLYSVFIFFSLALGWRDGFFFWGGGGGGARDLPCRNL